MFSGGYVAASFLLMFICIMLPLFFIIYYIFKKNFSFILMILGLVAFLIAGYFLTTLLAKYFAPASAVGQIAPAEFALRSALCSGPIKAVVIWIMLLLISKKYGTTSVPASFAVGYSFVDMVYFHGAPGFVAFFHALAVNQDGLESVVSNVDISQQETLRESILALAEKPASVYIWGAVDSICAFIVTICLARLIWYSIDGGIKEKTPLLVPVCIVAAFALDIPGALYAGGAFSSYAPAGIIYYVMTALLLAGTIYAARCHDEKVNVADSRLHRRGR